MRYRVWFKSHFLPYNSKKETVPVNLPENGRIVQYRADDEGIWITVEYRAVVNVVEKW